MKYTLIPIYKRDLKKMYILITYDSAIKLYIYLLSKS